jgi:HPr kinase/phosphorylase
MGSPEVAYYNRLDPQRKSYLTAELLAGKPPAIIIADDEIPPAELFSACEREGLALLRTPVSAAQIIEIARAQLSRVLAPQTQMHGVFMDVLGMGVLISGESGLGKSELALELITRGHGLIADDVVDFTRVAPDAVEGRCPPLLQNLLEVRGLGLLDIRTIFGETSVRRKMRLKLIVQMIRRSVMDEFERLPLEAMSQEIMGLPIRKVVIPVAAGRNLAVLVEAAVRNTVLSLRGIDTMQEFVERQQAAMRDSQDHSDPKGSGPNGSGHSQ